jgi:hypothetical protein
MRTSAWALLLAGCATSWSPPARTGPAEPNASERACLEAITRTSERLGSAEFSFCGRDSDCQGISPLLTGHCGTVANAAVFDAHLEEFKAQTELCDPVVQLVPRCLSLRPVCREQRCVTEPVSVLPEECTEQRAVLEADAQKANTCETDTECTVLEKIPTSAAFALASLDRREALARDCGTVPPDLFGARPQPPEAFCIEHRCVTEKASANFTTVVRSKSFKRPEFEARCITDQFLASMTNQHPRGGQFTLAYAVTIDTQGRQNQFEFLEPAQLSLDAQRALASRLRECRAQPAQSRGKPVAVRHVLHIQWIRK